MAISQSAEAGARKAYGIYVSPGLGGIWEGRLKTEMDRLFVTRMASIPWLPAGWLAGVRDLQSRYPDDLVRIAPAMGRSLIPNPESPDWLLQDQARIDAWQVIAKASDNAIIQVAAGKQAEGKAELDQLYANAAFWDRAYNLAVGVRDAVPNAIGWVGSNLWNGLGWKLKLGLAIAGAAAAYYYWPKLAKLAKAARA